MPEFILDHGSPDGARAYRSLDAFAQGYVEAMFFTSTGHGEDDDLENASVDELALETLARIVADCTAFQSDNAATLALAYERDAESSRYDDTRAGRDFWFSRNGHGVGFWDRGLGELGDALHKAAKHRDVSLYRGDDGLIYLA